MLISVTQVGAGEWEQADLHYVDHLLNADVLRACNPSIQSNGQLKRRRDACDGWRNGHFKSSFQQLLMILVLLLLTRLQYVQHCKVGALKICVRSHTFLLLNF